MSHKKTKTVIENSITELAELSEKIGCGFDKEYIHDFVVAVKTLRSILRLLNIQSHKRTLEIPGSFKRL